jgi:hypothetical protein
MIRDSTAWFNGGMNVVHGSCRAPTLQPRRGGGRLAIRCGRQALRGVVVTCGWGVSSDAAVGASEKRSGMAWAS